MKLSVIFTWNSEKELKEGENRWNVREKSNIMLKALKIWRKGSPGDSPKRGERDRVGERKRRVRWRLIWGWNRVEIIKWWLRRNKTILISNFHSSLTEPFNFHPSTNIQFSQFRKNLSFPPLSVQNVSLVLNSSWFP